MFPNSKKNDKERGTNPVIKLGNEEISDNPKAIKGRIAAIIVIVIVLLICFVLFFLYQKSTMPENNANGPVSNMSNEAISSNNAMNETQNLDQSTSNTSTSTTTQNINQSDNASANTNGDIPDANGIHQGLPGDSVPYYENENETTSKADPVPFADDPTGYYLRNDANTMDRDRLKSIVKDFIPKYFNTKGNGGTRAQKLMDYLDIDYINKQKYNSSLYNDIILNEGIGGFVVPQKSEYVSMGDITIDNAQSPNAVLRVSVTYKTPAGGDDGAPVTEQERTQTVKIYFNENYKIKDVKYA